jgi:hypothetical protein
MALSCTTLMISLFLIIHQSGFLEFGGCMEKELIMVFFVLCFLCGTTILNYYWYMPNTKYLEKYVIIKKLLHP